jgi:hypothetical protein
MKIQFYFFWYFFCTINLLFAQNKGEIALSLLAKKTTATQLGNIYDQILRNQNTAIDREIVLRQKLRYADRATLQLFKAKDSLLTALAHAYERPIAKRHNVTDLQNQVVKIEDEIIARVSQSDAYYKALSVKFAKEVYKTQPSLGCLVCYSKIKMQNGNNQLAKRLRDYATKKEVRALHWQAIRDELSEQEAAIEFVTYPNAKNDTVFYGAFVLRREYNAPVFVALFNQFELGALLQKGNADDELYQLLLYQPLADENQATLYDLIWKPIESTLKNTQKIYYAPTADLHRLNLAAISQHENTPPLQDKYEFARINSTRNLINTYAKSANNTGQLPSIYMPCLAKIIANQALIARFFGNVDVDFYDPTLAKGQQEAALFGNIVYEMDSVVFLSSKAAKHLPKQVETQKKNPKTAIK